MSKTQQAKASQAMNLDDVGIVSIVFKSMIGLLNALQLKKEEYTIFKTRWVLNLFHFLKFSYYTYNDNEELWYQIFKECTQLS